MCVLASHTEAPALPPTLDVSREEGANTDYTHSSCFERGFCCHRVVFDKIALVKKIAVSAIEDGVAAPNPNPGSPGWLFP